MINDQDLFMELMSHFHECDMHRLRMTSDEAERVKLLNEKYGLGLTIYSSEDPFYKIRDTMVTKISKCSKKAVDKYAEILINETLQTIEDMRNKNEAW